MRATYRGGSVLVPLVGMEWKADAACGLSAGRGDLWFSERSDVVPLAKAICDTCPVQQACLAFAMNDEEAWGVWAA